MPNSTPTAGHRSGFTLIELLVVISIIGILLALLLPAVQRVRAAAARTHCQNNLKQIGIAFHCYHGVRHQFPPGRVSTPTRHGWSYKLLPYLEQSELYNAYDQSVNWSAASAANRAARRVQVVTFRCPAISGRDRFDTTVNGTKSFPTAVSDYAPIASVSNNLSSFLGFTTATFPTINRIGALETDKETELGDFLDGTSRTILIAEDADRPNRWELGKFTNTNVTGAGWADDAASFAIDGFDKASRTSPGDCMINCTSANEVYGFHPSGANVLFADGSVFLIREGIDPVIMVGFVTKRASDKTVPPGEL